jgi:ornithine cyclodeaminase
LATKNDNILYLSGKEVELVCQSLDLPSIVANVLVLHAKKHTILPDEAYLEWMNGKGQSVRSLNMPSFIEGKVKLAGTKIINGNIHNVDNGLARASGLILLFDPETGRIRAIVEASFISAHRTASISLLSAKIFKGREIESIAIIGAGVLARAHVDILPKSLFSLRNIRIFDQNFNRSLKLQEELRYNPDLLKIEISIADSAEHAIRGSDLIIPVTTTNQGYIAYDWLKAGAILINISLDDPLPEVFLKANRIFVDDWHLVSNDQRRILGRMYHDGLIGPPSANSDVCLPRVKSVNAELGEVIIGNVPARLNDDEVILVNPFGLSIEDIAVASNVYDFAIDHGLGCNLYK